MSSSDGGHLRLLLIHLRLQTSDSLLKLTVLGGVDERVDTAVDGLQYKREVVEPASEVDRVAKKVDKEHDFNRCPTDDESAAHHQ